MKENISVLRLGSTFAVTWSEDGLARSVTAPMNGYGATYSYEVAPGEWRKAKVKGTRNLRFSQIKQLSAMVELRFFRHSG